MAVPELFNTIEQSGLSKWIRDGEILGFYLFLLFHAFGLSLAVGGNAVITLRMWGVARDLPLKSLKWLFPVMWVGIWTNIVSGVLLVISYTTKSLTNPVFYMKLIFIAAAVYTMQKMKRRVFDTDLSESQMLQQGKGLAMWSLIFWLGAVTTGRLLAYTYTYLFYGVKAGG